MIPIAPYYQRQRAIRAAEKKIGRAPRIVALALRRIRQERATLERIERRIIARRIALRVSAASSVYLESLGLIVTAEQLDRRAKGDSHG